MQFTHLLGKHLSYSVTSMTRHATSLRNRIGSCRNWMGYVPGDFTTSDFTCKRISRKYRMRALCPTASITPIGFLSFARVSDISNRLKRTASIRVGVFVDYAAGLDKMEHADRNVKQSIVMSSWQLLANVTMLHSLACRRTGVDV